MIDKFPRIAIACGLVVAMLGGVVSNVAAAPKGIRTYDDRRAAPPLHAKGGPSDRISQLQLDGKVVVVNFWATWCAPCKAELPSMDRLYRDLDDQGLAMLAIAVGDSVKAIQRFQARAKLSIPLIPDETKQLADIWAVGPVPITYVLDKHGKIAMRVIGDFDWQSDEIVDPIRALLAEPAG